MRPEFRQLLADLALGVIFYDLDRLVRQPQDLEDLIAIVEYVKRPVTGVTGGRMNLINDSVRRMARTMCVMALKSSEDTARRVARQHLSAAQNGQVQGRIAYGWVRKGERKGQLIPDEADLGTRTFQDFLAGESTYSIAKAFNSEGRCGAVLPGGGRAQGDRPARRRGAPPAGVRRPGAVHPAALSRPAPGAGRTPRVRGRVRRDLLARGQHRARLSGAETERGPGPLRGPQLARLAPPRHSRPCLSRHPQA
ncbi:recombinase family protein [Streptomyces sp. NPDC058000]|uniref:recombinase family protein n=1 Tax=Streptomyces sp. NPDC058000 TaxID=3346299 RepID=UPI0036EDC49E